MEFFDHSGISYDAKLKGMMKNGLIVQDEGVAQDIFQDLSPFHLEYYGLYWIDRQTGRYREGTTIELLYEAYHCDRALKNCIFDFLADMEVQLRNVVGYVLNEHFGAFGYLDSENFKNEDYHHHFLNDVENELTRANEPFVKAFRNRADPDDSRDVPVYVALEVVTMGTLSKVVSNLKRPQQKELAMYYHIRSEQVLNSFLKVLTTIRNTCAHHGRLLYRNFPDGCAVLNEDRAWIQKCDPDYILNPNALFVAMLALVHLLDSRKGDAMLDTFVQIFERHPDIPPALGNFPDHWEDVLRHPMRTPRE